jgi:hypothetical protein
LGRVSVASPCPIRVVDLVIDNNHEALACWVIASGTGVIGASEQVVRGVEEPLEHHWVRYAAEVPLSIPVQCCGRQLAGRAVIRLVVGGGDEIPERQQVVARKVLVHRHISAGG